MECLTLHLPPLRERGDDVLLLARHFLRRLAEEHGGRPPALSSSAVRALRHYPWPGNVRELRNAVTRAAARTTGAVIEAADLGLTRPTPEGDGRRAANGTAAPRPHASPVQLLRSRRLVVDFNLVDRIDLEGLKRDLIRQAIEASGGNQTEAARRLGLSRNAIRYAVKKYGLAGTS
ncbi:MAG: hypothetical protein D6739_05835 [Nitrospirae bacterium]|nr:MAG: hypothetical protein D6739_05835 [Nitrospirota bacterium]